MIKRVLFTLFLISSSAAQAFDNKYTTNMIDIEKLSVEHKWYDTNRDPYFPDKTDWETKTGLYWNVRLYRIFWDNNVHMSMDSSQVRTVGWQYVIGFHVTTWFDLVKDHHSRHVLEGVQNDKFPVEDSYGFRINFIPSVK